jgi:hypothetical protein
MTSTPGNETLAQLMADADPTPVCPMPEAPTEQDAEQVTEQAAEQAE